MPKLLDFYIEFEKPDAVYYPGETVSGKVVVNLTEPRTVRELRTKTRGVGKVHWTERHTVSDGNGKYHTKTRHYRNKEHYFRKLSPLFSSETGEDRVKIPAGETIYYFAFPLPMNIPSNFEHEYGHVRYVVKAVLDRPWKIDDKVEEPFIVIAPFNSEALRDLSEGFYDEFEHDFHYCCCFNSGSMSADVTAKTSAYSSGEIIELVINIDNQSTVDITDLRLKLKKNLTFIATTKKKYVSEDLEIIEQPGPFDKQDQIVMQLEVPPGPYSNLEDCSVIGVDYELSLTFNFSGMHSNIKRYYVVQLYDKVSNAEPLPELLPVPIPEPIPGQFSVPLPEPIPGQFSVPLPQQLSVPHSEQPSAPLIPIGFNVPLPESHADSHAEPSQPHPIGFHA